MSSALAPATLAHAELLEELHKPCFAAPWNAASLSASLDMPGAAAAIAVEDDAPAGFILWRAVAGEAEILTLAVLPERRRRGVGARLLAESLRAAADSGATAMFLEVATDNTAARALYEAAGFTVVGLRKGYYDGADALTMRRDL